MGYIQDIFVKTNGDFKVLNRRTFAEWYYMMKHLILPKNKKLMGINVDLLQWFIIFFVIVLVVADSKLKIFLIKKKQKNYTNQLLENLIKEKYTHL